MVRSILDIGNAKYEIDTDVLSRFKEEAQRHAVTLDDPYHGEEGSRHDCENGSFSVDASLDNAFDEVMQLYNEYSRSENLDVLVMLKCKLEQVSLRYKSVTLAEEVLSINSCLPYERRVPYHHGPGAFVVGRDKLPE